MVRLMPVPTADLAHCERRAGAQQQFDDRQCTIDRLHGVGVGRARAGEAGRSYHGQSHSARSPRDHRIAAGRVNQGAIALAEEQRELMRMAQKRKFGESGIRSPRMYVAQ